MRILRPAAEAEVVAAFLRAELDSRRFGAQLRGLLEEDGVDATIVTAPDVDDDEQNAYRESLLERHRGWLRRVGLFAGFPRRVDWWRAALAPDEVLAMRYINWDWWVDASAGTRDPRVTAERIRRREIPGVSVGEHARIAERGRDAPELIAAALPQGSTLVIVEGHARVTAYALFPECLPDELEIFLGTSDEMSRWSEF